MPSALPRPHAPPWSLKRSEELLERAGALMPGLTSSMMKRPEHFAPGAFPSYLVRGRGAKVEDVDGNEYVDFIAGLGANALGHQHPAVLGAIRQTLEDGLLQSLPIPQELEAARQLVQAIPGAERVRFFKTGADATSAAVRLARAHTGRARIVAVGYNGWHDHFMFDTPGVPPAVAGLSSRMPLFTPPDEEALLAHLRTTEGIAALVLSLPYNRVVGRAFMHALREVCTERGIVFVFDEIVTGFRIAPGGAQALFEVQPDLSCFSKALAAGMPLSAVTGGAELMDQMATLQVSTTFGGELLSLAAATAAMGVYAATDYYAHIAALGRRLREGVDAVAASLGSPLRVHGYDPLPFFRFDSDPQLHVPRMTALQGQLARRGYLLRRDLNFICAAHSEDEIDGLVDAVASGLRALEEER